MIGSLRGEIVECRPGRVVLDVAGVGYELLVPLSTFYVLAGEGCGATARLLVHTHVREDALQLFGFSAQPERAAFERLIAISGVGPKMALAILSGIGADELRGAIFAGDRARLQKIPGVGKKTAERVLLELRDKYDAEKPAEPTPGATPDGSEIPGGAREDAVSALTNLGYSEAIAVRSIDGALARSEGTPELELLLRDALARIVNGRGR